MIVEYIDHSGFTVELDQLFLVFDYFRGRVDLKDKPTLVFASHSHADHFNPVIFDWQKENPRIHYVLGYDIQAAKKENRLFMAPGDMEVMGDLEIRAFGSTDEGVSFLVKAEGKQIFHAGDLNWWHWDSDSPEEQLEAEETFKREISRIAPASIDLAFFPVDPRLGEAYAWGGQYFIDQLEPSYFFPCHFGENYTAIKQFAERNREGKTRILEIEKKKQIFVIDADR